MSYVWKVIIVGTENVSKEDQMQYEVECKTAREAANVINNHFGFNVASPDSVYNYFNRRHLTNKKIFGKIVFLERNKRKPKRKVKKSKSIGCECNTLTKASSSSPSECSYPQCGRSG